LFGYCWAYNSQTVQHDDAMSKSDATNLDLIKFLCIAHFSDECFELERARHRVALSM